MALLETNANLWHLLSYSSEIDHAWKLSHSKHDPEMALLSLPLWVCVGVRGPRLVSLSLSVPTLIYETVSLIESGAHRLTWLANFSASLLRPLVSVPSGHTQL